LYAYTSYWHIIGCVVSFESRFLMCKSVLHVCGSLLHVCKSLLHVCGSLLHVWKALCDISYVSGPDSDRMFWSLLHVYRSLLHIYIGLLCIYIRLSVTYPPCLRPIATGCIGLFCMYIGLLVSYVFIYVCLSIILFVRARQ